MGSLDEIQMNVAIPKHVARNPIMVKIADIAKVISIPYLSVEESGFNRQSHNHEHFRVHSKIAPNGKSLTLSVAANRQKTILSNVRISPAFEGLMPYCVMKSLPMHLVKKVTQHGAPSTCVVEGNKVETFDKIVYRIRARTFCNTVLEVRKTLFFDGFPGFRGSCSSALWANLIFFSYLGANISFTPLSQFSSNSRKNFLQYSLGSPKNPVFDGFLGFPH